MSEKVKKGFFAQYIQEANNYIDEKIKDPTPFVLFFGAGASYGSDNSRLFIQGKLPPLGNDLYAHLIKSSETICWKQIPEEAIEIFKENFELGLRFIMDNDEKYRMFYKLLMELALYFTKFEPEKNNLYIKLAQRLQKSRRYLSIITLNYDYMLQQALFKNGIFPRTIGIQKNDLSRASFTMPLDVIYPHGACQFSYYAQKDWEDEFYNETIDVLGGGLCHAFRKINIVNSYIKKERKPKSMPLMCAYEPDKRPFGKNCFIDYQRLHYEQTISQAKIIIIIGINCNYEKDRHLWKVLERTNAQIIFVEPHETGIEKIKQWNNPNVVGIIKASFKEAFEDICNLVFI